MKAKLSNNRGSALAMTIFIFTLVAVMASTLTIVIGTTVNSDLNTYRREQATLYAKAGLNLAYEYIADNSADDADFMKNYIAGKTFTGTITDVAAGTDGAGQPYDIPSEYGEGNKFTIECTLSGNIMTVTSTSTYQGVTAKAVRYFYQEGISNTANNNAIESFGSDITIRGTFQNQDGSAAAGDLRANKLNISGGATYSSLYALEGYKTNDSGLIVKNDIYVHDFVEQTNGAIGGDICSVGYAVIGNIADTVNGNIKSMIAYGRTSAAVASSDSAADKQLSDDGYAIEYSVNDKDLGDVPADPSSADYSKIVIYSGDDAKIDANGGNVYGTVVINGDLTINSSNNGFVIWGDLIVNGNINKTGGYYPTVEGKIVENGKLKELNGSVLEEVGDLSFTDAVNGRSCISAESIEEKLEWPRKFPYTILPNVCNKPCDTASESSAPQGEHPQRVDLSYWTSDHIETAQQYLQRKTEYKEFDISDLTAISYRNMRNGGVYGVSTGAGTGTVVDMSDSAAKDSFMNNKVFYRDSYNKNSVIIKINESGRYTGMDDLLNTMANQIVPSGSDQTSPAVVLVIDASAGDIDFAIDGTWRLQESGDWSTPSIKPQIIVNDKNGQNKIRMFLEEGAVLNLDGNTDPLNITTDTANTVVESLMALSDCASTDTAYTNDKADIQTARYSYAGTVDGMTTYDASGLRVPKLYIFSAGRHEADPVTGGQNLVTDSAKRGTVIFNTVIPFSFRGYVFAPYASITVTPNVSPVIMGKLEGGTVDYNSSSGIPLVYVPISDSDYKDAIDGVYFPTSSSGSVGGSGSTSDEPFTRSPAEREAGF